MTRSSTEAEPAALSEQLDQAKTVEAAADLVVGHCAALGFPLPSIYLERGGRLRCTAYRGYWQVYDGLPAGAGVLGTTLQTGEMSLLRHIGEHPDYIRAVPQVVAEVCLPLRHAGRVCGVLNVETFVPLTDEQVRAIRTIADAFECRLGALGGPPAEDSAELLARYGYELACLDDAGDIVDHTLSAAVRLSGMNSAGLFVFKGEDLVPASVCGTMAELVGELPQDTLRQLADYVSRATSSYASGDEPGDGFEATRLLRRSGVESLAVIALVAKGRRQGVIVLVDERPQPGIALAIPLLELLASISAAVVEAVGLSAALQESQRQLAFQATHDLLTGVANRGRLLDEVSSQLSAFAPDEGPVVLFVDLDGFKEVNDAYGHRTGDQLLAAAAERIAGSARSSDLVARIGGDEFVVMCRRAVTVDEATAVAQRVLDRLANPFHFEHVNATITACIGIAAAAPEQSAEELIAAADRAMYEAKARGRGCWQIASD